MEEVSLILSCSSVHLMLVIFSLMCAGGPAVELRCGKFRARLTAAPSIPAGKPIEQGGMWCGTQMSLSHLICAAVWCLLQVH